MRRKDKSLYAVFQRPLALSSLTNNSQGMSHTWNLDSRLVNYSLSSVNKLFGEMIFKQYNMSIKIHQPSRGRETRFRI